VTPIKNLAAALEFGLVLIGIVLLWRLVLSPKARANGAPAALSAWKALPSDFLLFLLHPLMGAFGGSTIAGLAARALGLKGDPLSLVVTAGMHLGMIAGVAAFRLTKPGLLDAKLGAWKPALGSGLATFLIALPIVYVVGFLWVALQTLAGLTVEQQPMVDLFLRIKSPGWILFIAITAGMVAPISEELVFRFGLFRYLRTRLPRWAALVLPAVIFAASHADLNTFGQLTALGIVFSLAYERTGFIGTTMVAHALFNLNSVLLLLAGIAV
jgi:hypothetical protein